MPAASNRISILKVSKPGSCLATVAFCAGRLADGGGWVIRLFCMMSFSTMVDCAVGCNLSER